MSTAVRFFTDEDIYGAVAPALRRLGYDALSTPESGRRGQADQSQLEWAAQHDRAIVTFNVGHFAKMHRKWIDEGRHHAGVIVSKQRPIGDVIARLHRLATTLDAETLEDTIQYLSNW